MINIPDDIPKHRKKSSRRPPKKSKHKHIYKNCLLSYKMSIGYSTGESIVDCVYLSEYCTICGKTRRKRMLEVTDEIKDARLLSADEILEKYKHLEKFEINGPFDKYVTLNNEADNS